MLVVGGWYVGIWWLVFSMLVVGSWWLVVGGWWLVVGVLVVGMLVFGSWMWFGSIKNLI